MMGDNVRHKKPRHLNAVVRLEVIKRKQKH